MTMLDNSPTLKGGDQYIYQRQSLPNYIGQSFYDIGQATLKIYRPTLASPKIYQSFLLQLAPYIKMSEAIMMNLISGYTY